MSGMFIKAFLQIIGLGTEYSVLCTRTGTVSYHFCKASNTQVVFVYHLSKYECSTSGCVVQVIEKSDLRKCNLFYSTSVQQRQVYCIQRGLRMLGALDCNATSYTRTYARVEYV